MVMASCLKCLLRLSVSCAGLSPKSCEVKGSDTPLTGGGVVGNSSGPSPSEGQFQGVSTRFLGRSRVGLVVLLVQGTEPQAETVPIPAPTFCWVSTFCPILLDPSLWLWDLFPNTLPASTPLLEVSLPVQSL